MAIAYIITAAVLQCVITGVQMHPERPSLLDPTQARELFKVAETNRTPDGFLTHEEVSDIFSVFDADGDSLVTGAEFKGVWLSRGLGDEMAAGYLFSRADTDQDGSITQFPDMQRVFSYFDIDNNDKVTEVEFIIIWNSLSN